MLCDGEDEVFSRFKFPQSPRRAIDRRTSGGYFDFDPGHTAPFMDDNITLASWFNLEFLDGSFGCDTFMDDIPAWPDDHPATAATEDAFEALHSASRLAKLVEAIMQVVGGNDLSVRKKQDIQQSLHHLLHPSQVNQSLALYFDGWHQICRIIHRPTFSIKNISDALLIAMVFLGAMYNPSRQDREQAAEVMDYAETFVFAQLHNTQQCGSILSGTQRDSIALANEENHCFHALQAAFLMVVTQYWTGSIESKQRVATIQFDKVVKVQPRYRNKAASAETTHRWPAARDCFA